MSTIKADNIGTATGSLSKATPESYGKVSNFAAASVRVHCRTSTGGVADQQRVCVAVVIS